MKLRPKLIIGDVVKLSKKGKTYLRTFPSKSSLVVSDIIGNGIEGSSVITCRVSNNGEYEYHKFYRSELWNTGWNVFNKTFRLTKPIEF